ncbi:ATP-binding protein [Ghiorsea bivora]|uniref:ATP-binding protein n=1 Tax=Ghiorsea bivora TaxID=1485545 RepID=UPI00068D6E69|nr:4Fe-4S dicluster domain-containing protein [Ghiorsea bivora]
MNQPLHTSSDRNIDETLHLLTLAHEHAAKGDTSLQISCAKLDKNFEQTSFACLAMLQPMLLACIAAEGIKEVYVETCKDCSTQHISSIIDDYKTLSQAMAIRLDVHLGKKAQTNVETATENKNEPSRRTFFRTLIPTLAKHAADNIQQMTQKKPIDHYIQDIINADSRLLPALHKLFLHALPKLHVNHIPVPVMEGLGLGNIQVSEACSACGKCVDICASKTLSLRKFGNRFILDFQADCCTGCNQCISICPEQAIEALPSVSLPSLIQKKPRPLVMVSGKP